MSITFEDAIKKIGTSELSSVTQFKILVESMGASAKGAYSDAISLLYSQKLPNGEDAWRVLDPLSNSSKDASGLKKIVYLGADTDIGQLLNDSRFQDGFREAIGRDLKVTDPLFDTLEPEQQKIRIKKEFDFHYSGKAADGITRISNNSFWDVASRNFVKEAKGGFSIIAAGAENSSVFVQTELPELLRKPGNVLVDGVSIDNIKKMGDITSIQKGVLEWTRTKVSFSQLSSSNFEIYKNWTFSARDALKDSALIAEEFARRSQASPSNLADIKAGEKAIANAARSSTSELLTSVGVSIGALAIGYSLYQISIAAQRAKDEDNGDSTRASKIVSNGVVELAAGIAVGAAVSVFAAGFLGALALATPIGIAAYAVFVVGGGIYSGIKGEQAVKYLLDKETGELPVVTVSDGWKTSTYKSGFEYREKVEDDLGRLNQIWSVPNHDGGYLQIQQDGVTNVQIRQSWSGLPGKSKLIEKTIYTPESATVQKVETITPEKADGSNDYVMERKSTIDGTVLEHFAKTVAANKSHVEFYYDNKGNSSQGVFDAAGVKTRDSWKNADGEVGSGTYDNGLTRLDIKKLIRRVFNMRVRAPLIFMSGSMISRGNWFGKPKPWKV